MSFPLIPLADGKRKWNTFPHLQISERAWQPHQFPRNPSFTTCPRQSSGEGDSRHVPPGSTLVFKDPSQGEGPDVPDVPDAAVLVLETESLQEGIWLTVKGIGASTEEEKKKVMGYFKSKKRKIHLCHRKPQECFQDEHEGLHLSKFHWYPPGDLTASWLTAHGRKAVADGKALELKAAKTTTDPADEKRKEAHGGESEVETRLSALRKRVPERVSFSASAVRLGRQREDEPRMEGGAGRFGARPKSPSASVSGPLGEEGSGRNTQRHCIRGQQEEQAEEEDNGRFAPESSSSSAQSHKEKKKKSRSRSRSSRRRKKRRHSSESESGEGSSRDSSSSEGSMMAPLKKKSRKTPGSVFQMLEEQAIEQLSADGILEEDYEQLGQRGQRPKIGTYYQLILKPNAKAAMQKNWQCWRGASRRPFARTRGRAVSTSAGGGHVDATRLGDGQASGSLLRGGHGECAPSTHS